MPEPVPVPDAPAPEVSVVVVTFDAPAELLERCTRSVAASTGVRAHLVLVDNGSADGGAAAEVAAAHVPGAVLVRRPRNGGFAAGVNAALASARAPWVFLLNNDAELDPAALSRCVAAAEAEDGTCAGVVPKVLLRDRDEPVLDSVGVVLRANGEAFNRAIGEPDLGQLDEPAPAFGPTFGAALLRRAELDPGGIGPLDERFFLYYEDVDWLVRAHLAGRRFVTAPAAVVHHGHAVSTRRLGEARRFALVQRNRLWFVAKDLEASGARRIWLTMLRVHAQCTIVGPYRRHRPLLVLRALAGLPAVLVARRRVQRTRTTPDAALFGFAAGEEPFYDPEAHEVSDPAAARAAAEARLRRRS